LAPGADSVAFALVAGALGIGGLFFFYYALGHGTMGVVAPLAALIGAGLPVFVAIYNGEQVSAARLAGIVLALVAVVLISLPGGEVSATERRKVRMDVAEIPLVVLAGLGFAGFFVFIGHATRDGGVFWPLAIVRAVGVAVVIVAFLVLLARTRGDSMSERLAGILGVAQMRSWPGTGLAFGMTFVVAGVGDLGGNVFFVLARHADLISVAVVLSSLYPVVTTILAALLLHERLRRLQAAGVILATISVVLLADPFRV
jgi:drug/metabolite transporter (DMT)-like permease